MKQYIAVGTIRLLIEPTPTRPRQHPHHLHLGGAGPPALVPHAEAAQALSLGLLLFPGAPVLAPGHRAAAALLLQLGEMLHAAVHLQMAPENRSHKKLPIKNT